MNYQITIICVGNLNCTKPLELEENKVDRAFTITNLEIDIIH